jgi:hypothetical protein
MKEGATHKKRNEPKTGTRRRDIVFVKTKPILTSASYVMAWSHIDRNAKQSQFPSFSTQKSGMVKKQSQIKLILPSGHWSLVSGLFAKQTQNLCNL